jgi:hypothetical protein
MNVDNAIDSAPASLPVPDYLISPPFRALGVCPASMDPNVVLDARQRSILPNAETARRLAPVLRLPFLEADSARVTVYGGFAARGNDGQLQSRHGVCFASEGNEPVAVHAAIAGAALQMSGGVLQCSFEHRLVVFYGMSTNGVRSDIPSYDAPEETLAVGDSVPYFPCAPSEAIGFPVKWLRAGERIGAIDPVVGFRLRFAVTYQYDRSGARRFFDPFGHYATDERYGLRAQDESHGLWLRGVDGSPAWAAEPEPFPEPPPLSVNKRRSSSV